LGTEEMIEVVVAEDALLAARIADARDHRRVIEFVREDHAAGQDLGQRRQRRLVGDIAAGEQQRRFLAVQIGEFMFQIDVIVRVAADVAGAAGARADIVQRLLHRRDHLRVLAHREIVVGTPDGDRLRPVMPGEAARVGERALVAQDVDEHPVPALGMQPVDRLGEDVRVVDARLRTVAAGGGGECRSERGRGHGPVVYAPPRRFSSAEERTH
jgi:hypothetical protein